MATFMHTLRLVAGLALVAGGVGLAQPFMAAVWEAHRPAAIESWAAAPAATPAGGAYTAAITGGHAIPDARQVDLATGPWSNAGMQPSGGVAPSGMPPPRPPAPLPDSTIDLSPASPALNGTYRSTVDIPPPPLLDGHAPPPLAVGWAAHDVAPSSGSVPTMQSATIPATYVVRDGDDLTGIALRVYGHAGAATAIWAANQDRLRDPQLLPIGLALQMPPSWTVPAVQAAHGAGRGESIEPVYASRKNGRLPQAADPESARPQARGDDGLVWLHGAAASNNGPVAFAAGQQAPPAAPASRPLRVRVGNGDSLDSIAVRFYGDRAMGQQIWQANRDQLRSPDLLVSGMELRLP